MIGVGGLGVYFTYCLTGALAFLIAMLLLDRGGIPWRLGGTPWRLYILALAGSMVICAVWVAILITVLFLRAKR